MNGYCGGRDAATIEACGSILAVALRISMLAAKAAVIGALALAVGEVVASATIALTLVAPAPGALLSGSAGQHIDAYLAGNAGLPITQARQQAADLLSPWAGLAVLGLWTAALLATAAFMLGRRDA